jgi:hypothetical protein
MTTNYYGEKKCQSLIKSTGKPCTNLTYFQSDGKLLCGVHSKKDKNRIKLKKNPNKAKLFLEEIKKHNLEIRNQAALNKNAGKKGDVVCSKLKMMQKPDYIKGYLNIFPNYKHQGRKDGFGCSRLSPKSLGPVNHNMPGIPPAKNLENYHQFAKFWKFELDKDNQIIDKYKIARNKAYQDPIPYRHKYDRKTLKKHGNVNVPEFSVYYTKNGEERRYNYLQCRYFYCHYYESLAQKEPDFTRLNKKINEGYNINIVGYDGYQVTKSIWDCYNDTSKPFGHELVLYTMLIEQNPKKYPWNIFYEKNKDLYKNIF